MSAQIAFKLVFKHDKQPQEIRRFSTDDNIAHGDLMKLIENMFIEIKPSKWPLVLEYVDEEGDKIAVHTPLEWQEAIRLHKASSASPFRITVRRLTPIEVAIFSDSDAETPSSDKKEQKKKEKKVRKEERRAQKALEDELKAAEKKLKKESKKAAKKKWTPTYVEGSTSQERGLIDLLSAVFQCNASLELVEHPDRFAKILKREVCPKSREVAVDVDSAALSSLVVQESCQLLEDGRLEEAEAMLVAAVAVFSGSPSATTHEYNLACAYAMMKKIDDANFWLGEAIHHGYNKYDQIMADPDLKAVRGTEEFARLMSKISTPTTSATAVAAECPYDMADFEDDEEAEKSMEFEGVDPNIDLDDLVAKDDEPKAMAQLPAEPEVKEVLGVAEPVLPVRPISAETEMLMTVFPQLDVGAAEAVLAANGNSVAKAVTAVIEAA